MVYEAHCLDWDEKGYEDFSHCMCGFMKTMPKLNRWACSICLGADMLWEAAWGCDGEQ